MNFITVIVITIVAVVAMINFKDWVNRSEAMRAMEHLSRIVIQYRAEHGSIPPESYIDSMRNSLEGRLRLGKLYYRARWLDFESPSDRILAYTEHKYHSLLFSSGTIVLRLDGTVEWVETQKFKTLLARQQSPLEMQMTQK